MGDSDQFQIFHYFIKSEANPKTDPLIIWLTGGPGCSALSGLAFEIGNYFNLFFACFFSLIHLDNFMYDVFKGPISFDEESNEGSIPRLILNPYSWTKVIMIISLS